MSLTINNNVSSLIAPNNLQRTSTSLNKSLERLSSGLKINRGADGPAALVISEHQRAQIAGLQPALDNASQAISMVQTAAGALTEMNGLLDKARSLALDSANSGVQDSNTLAANQSEIDNILQTITNIAERTQFGTKKLLNGAAATGTVTTDATGVTTTGTLSTAAAQASYTYSVTTAAKEAQGVGTGGFTGTGGALGTGNGGTLKINGVSVTLADTDTIDSTVAQINNVMAANGVNVQATNVGGQLALTATDFTTDIDLAGTTAATRTALGLAAGPFNHTNGVLQYTDSTNATVTVTGNGNVFNLTGELAGITVTLGKSSTAGSISSVA